VWPTYKYCQSNIQLISICRANIGHSFVWDCVGHFFWCWHCQAPVSFTQIVSPAYGYIESALVKCSNEGGPGPRHSMKGDHGSSIFNRQVVYYLNLLTFSRNRWQMLVPPAPPPHPPLGSLGRNQLPPLHGQSGQEPTSPLHRATPFPRKLSSEIDLGENLVLASKSGSEVMVRAQDDRMKHFWPNGISLRGQTAELETSAGWPARFSGALLCEDQAGRYNQG